MTQVPVVGQFDCGRLTDWKTCEPSAYLGMDQILPPKLNDLEFEALRQIAAHPASHHVPSRVQSRLKDIGYVKEVLGGLVLTDDGLRRIAMDK
jgi:hypothetical protein